MESGRAREAEQQPLGVLEYNEQLLGGSGYAYGLDRVPYDNFPALLHEGERVLTASQARAADAGVGIHVAKVADTVVVREDADIERIAREIVRQTQRAALLAQPG